MLADEPTGELDFRTGIQILELLHAQSHRGITVAHRHPQPRDRPRRRPGHRAEQWAHRARTGPRRRPGADRPAPLVGRRWASGCSGRCATCAPVGSRCARSRFIIAIGTGLYAGLSSTSRVAAGLLRRELRPAATCTTCTSRLSAGSYVDADRPRRASRGTIPHATLSRRSSHASSCRRRSMRPVGGKTILVPGRMVGVDVAHGGPQVNGDRRRLGGGRFAAGDAGADRAVLDAHFAKHHHLPDTGTIRVNGGETLDYVGVGLSPEYFMVVGDRGTLLAEANFAVMFVSARDGAADRRPTGRRQRPRHDAPTRERMPASSGAELRRRRCSGAFPGVGMTINGRGDDVAHRMLYDDIDGDQRLYNIFAVLILAGAAFAAFNLAGRIVEAQRREIGIGMALGVPRRSLAIRPLLVGAEIALLECVFGVAIGLRRRASRWGPCCAASSRSRSGGSRSSRACSDERRCSDSSCRCSRPRFPVLASGARRPDRSDPHGVPLRQGRRPRTAARPRAPPGADDRTDAVPQRAACAATDPHDDARHRRGHRRAHRRDRDGRLLRRDHRSGRAAS